MFSRAYKYYALAVVTAVYVVNLTDRVLMGLLLQPIKQDLQLSDTQLGFVTGLAFAAFYATLGLPIARWADRGNRVTITSLSIGIGSLAVMACMLVTSFLQLVFARIAAAIGEAGCKPATYSLVGDYFPEAAARTRAMAIYLTASSLASIISFIAGGWLNEHYGWRFAFFVAGIPGLVLAVLVKMSVVEPRTLDTTAQASHSLPSMRTVFATLWGQRSCRHLSLALVLLYMLGLSLSPWYAAIMIRSHGMGTAELGIWFGLIFGVGGLAGVLLGGYVASRWFASSEVRQVRMSAVTVALLGPCLLAFLALPQKLAALIALVPLAMAFTIFLGPTYALMQRLVTDEMRATTMAVVMLLANLIGMGIGPQVVGILSDLLAPVAGNDSLRYAMLVMSLAALWAAYHFWQVGRTVDEDLSAVSGGAEKSG